ncbi:MAG TPA: AGE family epimerase/isomerase [Pyrinomonadaceae bacterium]|nr:AGE family epimerase/isomerase [Pyrinomonadaceae bacterium]
MIDRKVKILVVLLVALAGSAQAQEKAATTFQAEAYAARIQRVLTENIADFWFKKSLDRKNGGYLISFDAEGNYKEGGTKMIVTQARMVWLFSRLARFGHRREESLAAAEIGYRFLKEKMWDAKNGGFYWEVDLTGTRVLRPKKHLYGQSFALYALSEYYLASRKPEALDFAVKFFNLLEAKSYDRAYGGYIEFFNEDWSPTPPEEASYMGAAARFKLMNTHLHLLEAMTTFYRASKLPAARDRLLELISIESSAVVRKNLGACTDKYERDWTPRLDRPEFARVSYGHDLENIWLLVDACEAAGVSTYPLLDLYRTLFDYSLKYGYDEKEGGFYYYGPFDAPAADRGKDWWVQAEAIVSALYMHRLTNEPKYLAVFERTYDFIEKNMVDWQHGEWHARITPEGRATGDKAQAWKAGYHNGRAMIECLALLKQISEKK